MTARSLLGRVDVARVAERAVLAGILAIAALISYTHLREVWLHAGAPWEICGPLLVDGLFASAWLQMRRRRREGDRVGWLAWVALVVSLVGMLAGNLAAAVIGGHRDPLSLAVAVVPAVVSALAWELVTGHGRQTPTHPAGAPGRVNLENFPWSEPASGTYEEAGPGADTTPAAPAVALHLAPAPAEPGDREEAGEDRAAELIAAGVGRRKLARELQISEHEARALIDARRNGTSP